MNISGLRFFYKHLKNNKLYTTVTIIGFAISLMFVLLLSIYVKQELSVDEFHENKDRIYLLAREDNHTGNANPAADLMKNNIPEIESYTRIVTQSYIYKIGEKQTVPRTLLADSSFFNIFSFPLLEGNKSEVLATKHSAVISQSFAKKEFPNTDPVGKTLLLGGQVFITITGIMKDFPNNTVFPSCDVVLNYQMIEGSWGDEILDSWDNASFTIFFLAKKKANLPSKSSTVLNLFLENNYWIYKTKRANEVIFIPLPEVYFRELSSGFSQLKSNNKTLINVYFIIAILILTVAILNYINLSVSQAVKRAKEVAMKKLLGSNNKSIVIQTVFESILMTLLAFLLGVIFAILVEPFFNDVLSTDLQLKDQLLNSTFMLLTLSFVIVVGAISSIIPAISISSFEPIEVVKGTYTFKTKSLYSKVLITFQYIVAICLLACSVFILKQTRFMQNYDMGFSKDNILILDNTLDGKQVSTLRNSFNSIAGVDKVSFSRGTPITGSNNSSFQNPDGAAYSFQHFEVDSLFFDIFNMKINSTGITNTKDGIWINQKGYNTLNVNPDDQRAQIGEFQRPIIGIVENFHTKSLHNGLEDIFFTELGDGWFPWNIIIKMKDSANPYTTANEIKNVYSELNGGKPFESTFADEIVQKWYEKEEKMIKILTAFTVLTLIILIMGIFAMTLYFVQQKEKEIGVRKVNGATTFDIIKMINLNFVLWILTAFIIATPISYYTISKWLESFPYKTPISWWIFILTGVFILFVSIIFITIQSWKAANKNPIETLKNE